MISSFNIIIYYSCLDGTLDDNKLNNNEKVECDAASTSSISKTADENSPLEFVSRHPYIKSGEEDVLYHLALSNKSHNFANMFGDVKVHINFEFLFLDVIYY